jgi:hypothetical protein
MEQPAAITAAGLSPRPFHYWTGRSGRPYVHSVFAPDALPRFRHASVLVARRTAEGRAALLVAATGEAPDLVLCSRAFAGALAEAEEVHVHLAADAADARAVADDLAALVSPAAGTASRPRRRLARWPAPDRAGA